MNMIQKEQDSLMEFYQPYYEIDKTQGEQMIQKFKDDYNKKPAQHHPGPGLSASY